VRREDGDLPGAGAALGEALSILRGIGDRVGEAEALNETGVLRLASGDLAGSGGLPPSGAGPGPRGGQPPGRGPRPGRPGPLEA